jgi:hypothetical protein
MENVIKLKIENIVCNAVPVIKLSILLWSFIRCKISPVCFVSKKFNGKRISLIQKSDRMLKLICVLTKSNILLRMNSTIVLAKNKTNCAIKINCIKFKLWVLIPVSTILCVRNGNINCNKLPMSRPKNN